MSNPIVTGYDHFRHDLKTRIRSARTRAALAANRELVLLYWQIGRDILERQDAKAGAQRSLSGWRGICGRNSRT